MIHRRGSVYWIAAGLLLAAVSGPTYGRNDLDVTMRLVGEHEDITESVSREIRLPELPALQSRSRGHREAAPGPDIRQQARERGREFGQSMSERARDVHENRPQRPSGGGRPDFEPGKKPELPPQSSRP